MTTEATFTVIRRKPLYRDLSLQVLVAMLLGVAVGLTNYLVGVQLP